MAYVRKRGIAIWGPVWSMGSKIGDDEFGRYWEFALRIPCRADKERFQDGKIFVRWYYYTFRPTKGQYLECAGYLGVLSPGHLEWRKDKAKMMIRCFGEADVKVLEEPPKTLNFAQREWGRLVQGPILEGEAGPGTEAD